MNVSSVPVRLRVAGRQCVIVGGGAAALIKATSLIEAQALVCVIAPEFVPGLIELGRSNSERLTLIERTYQSGDVDAAFAVISVTGIPAVDQTVIDDARACGALVAAAGRGVDIDDVDFVFSASALAQPISIGVNSLPQFPALTTWARDRIGEFIAQHLQVVAAAAVELRNELASDQHVVSALDWKSALDAVMLVEPRAAFRDDVKEQLRSCLLS